VEVVTRFATLKAFRRDGALMQDTFRPVQTIPIVLTALSVALLIVGLRGVHLQGEGPTGLISVMPTAYLLALVTLASAFVIALFDPRRPWWLPALQTVLIVCAIGGLGSFVEAAPRIAVTYTHLGFAQYVGSHGQPLPPFDARADWPGAFALLAFVEAIGGPNTAFTIGRWAPLFFDLLWIFPLVALGDIITGDDRWKWVGTWIFLLANWTEEDYLSPQAFDFTLYLVIIVVLLAAFAKSRSAHSTASFSGATPQARRPPPRWRTLLLPSQEPRTPWSDSLSSTSRVALALCTIFLAAVATLSHQLTPYMLILESAALVVFGRIRLAAFPWIVAVMAIGWISFAAVSFWSGHLSLLFGSAGNVGQNFSSGVTGRIQGTLGHRLVLACRIGIALFVIGIALGSWWRDRSRGSTRTWLLAAMAAPALLVAAQDYGGEGVIRSYLFLLPFASMMGAALLHRTTLVGAGGPGVAVGGYAPSPPLQSLGRPVAPPPERPVGFRRSTTRRALAIGLAVVVLSGATLMSVVARYGEDQVEQVTQDELTTMAWFYRHVPTNTTVFTVCVNLPWRYTGAAAYTYKSLSAATYRSPAQLLAALSPGGSGAYLITTPRQGVCEEELDGLPDNWLGTLRANLQRTGRSKVIYSADGDEIDHIEPLSHAHAP
jgi:hypothetical protein